MFTHAIGRKIEEMERAPNLARAQPRPSLGRIIQLLSLLLSNAKVNSSAVLRMKQEYFLSSKEEKYLMSTTETQTLYSLCIRHLNVFVN